MLDKKRHYNIIITFIHIIFTPIIPEQLNIEIGESIEWIDTESWAKCFGKVQEVRDQLVFVLQTGIVDDEGPSTASQAQTFALSQVKRSEQGSLAILLETPVPLLIAKSERDS